MFSVLTEKYYNEWLTGALMQSCNYKIQMDGQILSVIYTSLKKIKKLVLKSHKQAIQLQLKHITDIPECITQPSNKQEWFNNKKKVSTFFFCNAQTTLQNNSN